jgi:hypothetical protein
MSAMSGAGTPTGVSWEFTVAISAVVMDEVLMRQQRPAGETAVAVDDHEAAPASTPSPADSVGGTTR